MPNPLPLNLGTIAQEAVQLDFIQRATPTEPANTIGAPLFPWDYQRQEPNFPHCKKRWQSDVFPFRMFYTSPDGWAYLQSIHQKWETIPRVGFNGFTPGTKPGDFGYGINWGEASILDQAFSPGIWTVNPATDAFWADLLWSNLGSTFAHFWLYSVAVDSAAFGLSPYRVQVMQFLATRALDYQIWKVTLRCPVDGPDYQVGGFYNGYLPPVYPPITAETPWAGSSDFAQVPGLGGSLKIGDVLTISPHDLDPRHNAQSPPAAGNPDGVTLPANPTDQYWSGWGVANYLVIID